MQEDCREELVKNRYREKTSAVRASEQQSSLQNLTASPLGEFRIIQAELRK